MLQCSGVHIFEYLQIHLHKMEKGIGISKSCSLKTNAVVAFRQRITVNYMK